MKKAPIPMLVTFSGIIVAEHPAINLLLLVSTIALHPLRESYMVLPSATIMETRLLQPEEREPPILTTLLGIVMETRLLQSPKALRPMLVTLSGMFMKVRLLQPKKPNSPMLVTLSGMIVLEHPITSLLLLVSMIALHPFRESYIVFPSATIMEVRPLQLLKAEYSIFVTLFGMLMEVRLLQLEKAELPIFVTLSGIFMEERLLQCQKT